MKKEKEIQKNEMNSYQWLIAFAVGVVWILDKHILRPNMISFGINNFVLILIDIFTFFFSFGFFVTIFYLSKVILNEI